MTIGWPLGLLPEGSLRVASPSTNGALKSLIHKDILTFINEQDLACLLRYYIY
jgi:hypothetical protein